MKLVNCLVKATMLAAFILQASCTDTNDILQPKFSFLNGEDYFPLQLGNHWELAHLSNRSIKIIELIDGVPYYGMVTDGDTTYYRKTSDGKVYQRKKTTEETLKFDLSADEGQIWTYKESDSDYTWYVMLSSKNDTIRVGDHSFLNCYRFYLDIPQKTDDEKSIWLAPGIGFIEEHYIGGTADRKVLTKAKIDGVKIEL